MQLAFKERGDLQTWSPTVLDDIDNCFLKIYKPDGQLSPYLFFPDNFENKKLFTQYCTEVENVLRHAKPEKAPPHARAWFVYFSIYNMQDYKFPMPLGTASVVQAVNDLLMGVQLGFVEVSSTDYLCARYTAHPLVYASSILLRVGDVVLT